MAAWCALITLVLALVRWATKSVYIHGNGARSDWTWGCVALENEDIRELYEAVTVGTPVIIKP